MLMCGTDALQIVCAKECSAGQSCSSVRPSAGAHGVTRPTRELRRLTEVSWDRDRAVKRACNFEFVSTISKRRKLIATLLLSWSSSNRKHRRVLRLSCHAATFRAAF